MALTPFSLLLRRRISFRNPYHPFLFSDILKPFSTAGSQPNPDLSISSDPKPSNLSARLSFVFDQIDTLERERSQKDDTLQRIRAWRESKSQKKTAHEDEFEKSRLGSKESGEFGSATALDESNKGEEGGGLVKKELELVHPWPEWIELMERLVQQNYFDHKRKDEDKMVEDLGFDMSEVVEEGFDFTRDWKTVQTACLNFGRNRFDIFRSLSRQDIQVLVGYGCPSADKKVVFSAKLLRKHVHLDEGDVCSSCSLRSSCERAYLVTNKEDEARTMDIMRVLLTYAFDHVNGSVVNRPLLKQKTVKTVVRKLLHQIVKLSAVPIDPNLPPPVFKKPPPKVKQPPPPPKKRVGRDDIEMKKGDWLCPKCDFMNFAKNTVCLQCDAKRPKRQLLPGEWECPECNFLNYRRNMACFHCECRRPPDEFMENQMQERQRGPRTRLEKVASRAEVSSAWNFDFDDNESDGADVAAFEYADTPRMGEDFPVDVRAQGGNIGGSDDDFHEPAASRVQGSHEREYSADSNRPGKGFDDFDDEEDDIDSYEIDTRNSQVRKPSSNEGFSESEDFEGPGSNQYPHRRESSSSYKKPSKPMRPRAAFSGSDEDGIDIDSDEDLSVHPNWKSSHVANSRQSRGRRSNGPSRGLSFGSDEDLGLSSGAEDDDFGSRKNKKDRRGSNRRELRSQGRSDSEDDSFGSDSSDDDPRSTRNSSRGNKAGPSRGGNKFKGRGGFDFTGDSRYSSSGKMSDRRNSFSDNFDRSSRGSRGSYRGGLKGGGYGGHKRNDRGDDMQNFNGPRRGEGYGNEQRGHRRNDRGDNVRNFNGPRREEGYGDQQHGPRRNERGGGARKFTGPRRDEGYGNKQPGRFRENDGDQNFGDDRPRRIRIIER